MDSRTLNALRAAARSGTSRRHAQALAPGTDLDQIARDFQRQDGEPDAPLNWDTWAARERERFKLALKTRRLNEQ